MIYDSGGNFVSESGKRGKDSGDFNHPRGMAVDAHDRIYILDSWNNVCLHYSILPLLPMPSLLRFAHPPPSHPRLSLDKANHGIEHKDHSCYTLLLSYSSLLIPVLQQDRIQVFDPAGGHLISCFIGPSDPCCLDITVSKKSGQIYLLGRSMKILSPFCM